MQSLIYMYSGLPRVWYNESVEEYKISDDRYTLLCSKLKNLPKKPVTLYIQNACSIFVNKIFNDYKIKGIDFAKYFDNRFNKEAEAFTLPEADIIVIYNVGLESAVNTTYSSKLLYALMEQIKQNGSHLFLCSHLSPSKFESSYNIDIVNKIIVQKHKEEQFI